VNSNKLWMTATIPSGFGMPMSCHASGATTVVRERVTAIAGATDAAKTGQLFAAKAGLGLTQSYNPGNSAWRPPTC
jgi:hypothetical protein